MCGFAKVIRDTTGHKLADENNRFMAEPEPGPGTACRSGADDGGSHADACVSTWTWTAPGMPMSSRRRSLRRHGRIHSRLKPIAALAAGTAFPISAKDSDQLLRKGRPYVVNDIVAESPEGNGPLAVPAGRNPVYGCACH